AGATNSGYTDWLYLNCLKTLPSTTPAAGGSCTFTVNTPAGSAEFRIIRGAESNPPRLVSPSFTVISTATNTPTPSPTPTVSLSVNTSSVTGGGSITVSWAN